MIQVLYQVCYEFLSLEIFPLLFFHFLFQVYSRHLTGNRVQLFYLVSFHSLRKTIKYMSCYNFRCSKAIGRFSATCYSSARCVCYLHAIDSCLCDFGCYSVTGLYKYLSSTGYQSQHWWLSDNTWWCRFELHDAHWFASRLHIYALIV